jgi:hypothetical protein
MNRDSQQLWGGALLVVLGAVVLFASVVFGSSALSVLVVGTLLLAAGSLLVGWSRRGRPV